MWQPTLAYHHSDLADADRKAIDGLMDEAIKAAHVKLASHSLAGKLQWEFPHHRYVWCGPSLVVVVGDPTTGDNSSLRYKEGSDQRDVDSQTVVKAVRHEFGFKSPFWIAFPRVYLNATADSRNAAVDDLARQLTKGLIEEARLSSALGIGEALSYLANARRRLDENTPEAMADVKTNCRNAIESLMQRITATSNFSKAKRGLMDQGVFTKHEAAFVDALASLLDAFFDVASMPGSHPPQPSLEDASFVLQIAEATVHYIAQRALAARQDKQARPE